VLYRLVNICARENGRKLAYPMNSVIVVMCSLLLSIADDYRRWAQQLRRGQTEEEQRG
jgi:hypothetical protein